MIEKLEMRARSAGAIRIEQMRHEIIDSMAAIAPGVTAQAIAEGVELSGRRLNRGFVSGPLLCRIRELFR